MLSSMIAKRALLRNARFFGTLSTQNIDAVIRDPAHANWNQFFSQIKPADVASETDHRAISKLLVALSHSDQSHEAAHQEELYSAIDQYFKSKFRKISSKEALEILLPLGEGERGAKLTGLDEKFWVWETLEEAIRPVVRDMN